MGCGGDGDAAATPTEAPGDEVATATQGIAPTVVPNVTRDAGRDTTPEPPREEPSPDNVRFEEAFPDLPLIERPVAMLEIPGADRFLVVSQEGFVFSFAAGGDASELVTVLDWEERTRREGNEEGLLGIALSPEFDTNGYVFLYYTAADGDRRSVVSRFETTGEGAELRIDGASELVILEVAQPYPNHNGGQIEFGPDGMLYIALGDGGAGGDPHGHGQDLSTLLGSILRIDVSAAMPGTPYAIPDDNPFVGAGDARGEIWAYGLRNPWRYSFDTETDAMWLADVGQNSREEVNRVEAGGNYGWNVMEGFECYGATDCDETGLTPPVLDYARADGNCSVTGGYVGRGDSAGVLEGWYVFGDYCSGKVWTFAVEGAEPGSRPEVVELRSGGPQMPSFARSEDGTMYILGFDGRIYRIAA